MRPEQPCGDECAQALARLWEYLDSELGELDIIEIRRHLEACSGCLDEHQVALVMKRVLRRGCAEQAPHTLRLRVQQLTIRSE